KLDEVVKIGRVEVGEHPHRPAMFGRAAASWLYLVADEPDDRSRRGLAVSASLVLQSGEEIGIDPDGHHGRGCHVLHCNTDGPRSNRQMSGREDRSVQAAPPAAAMLDTGDRRITLPSCLPCCRSTSGARNPPSIRACGSPRSTSGRWTARLKCG